MDRKIRIQRQNLKRNEDLSILEKDLDIVHIDIKILKKLQRRRK